MTVAPATSVAKGRILDPANADKRSPIQAMAINAISGAVFGLALGCGWVILRELISDKVRRSESLAAALHAPVAITTGRLGGSARRQRARFRRYAIKPGPDIAHVVRVWCRLCAGRKAPANELVVVAVGSELDAACLVACAASELARGGADVVVVDLTERSVLASVVAVAPNGVATVEVPRSEVAFQVVFRPAGDGSPIVHTADLPPYEVMAAADVMLSLTTTAGLMEPTGRSLKSGATAAIVVGSGTASAARLRSAGRMLLGRRLKVDHVVVVGADRGDEGGPLPGAAWVNAGTPSTSQRRVSAEHQ